MRNMDNNRAANYIKKHERHKKWIAFALCLSLLTGTITLYVLNKPATAMTEEGAKSIGLVLETADDEFEAGLIEEMEAKERAEAEESDEANEESGSEQEQQDDASGDTDENSVSEGNSENADEGKESESSAENYDVAAESSSDEAGESDSAYSASSEEASESASVELDEDVIITVLYQDADGEEISESKALKISESFDIKEDVRSFEGYIFDKAVIDETEVSRIIKKTSEADDELEEHTYYEVVTADSETINITEDTDLQLIYDKVNEQDEFLYEEEGFKVTARLSDPAIFPAGVELKVTALTRETEGYNYDAYMDALNDNAEAIADEAGLEAASTYNKNNTLLFDIAFMHGEKEIQPSEGSVDISVEFTQNQLSDELDASEEAQMTLVHLPLKEEVKESSEVATTQDATDITASDIEVKTLTEANIEVGGTELVEFTEDGFSVFAVTVYQDHTSGTDTYRSVLGDAVNFGIVSDELYVNESETNFAVKKLIAQAQSGNDMTNPVEQTFIAGEIQITDNKQFTIKGEKAYFIVPKEHVAKVKHQQGNQKDNTNDYITFDTAYTTKELNTVVDEMLDYVRAASKDLAGRTPNATIEENTRDKARLMVDHTTAGYDPNGTYYVTLSDEDLKTIGEDQKLYIYKRSGQTVVFNVPQGGDVSIGKYMVSTDGGEDVGSDTLAGRREDPVARTIIWNFQNASNVYTGGGLAGVFISGNKNATWHNTKTSAGWIAFPNVKITAEFHNTYDEVQQISGTAQLEAYKNIDGEAATVSGFKFKMAIFDGLNWRDLQTVTNSENSPHDIIFDAVTFGGDKNYSGPGLYQYVDLKNVGDSKEFKFVIDETEGTTDSEGNAYIADEANYFAKVTVTLMLKNEFSKNTYYKVSKPLYYKDFECTKPLKERPVFENATKTGSVGIKLYKYLNNEDPGKHKFTFTVRQLTQSGELEVINKKLTQNGTPLKDGVLSNDGKSISFELNYKNKDIVKDDKGNSHVYLIITENETTPIDGIEVEKDKGYIFVSIDIPKNDKEKPNVVYYKIYEDDSDSTVRTNMGRLLDDGYKNKTSYIIALFKKTKNRIDPKDYAAKLAFFNTGKSKLKIHKMVVNDFGKAFVRDNGDSIINSVKFRITNNITKNYVILWGFAGAEGQTAMQYRGENAIEYDATSHKPTGRTFEVVCNGNAQWTILGLDIGTYTVDEVSDGFTFSYDPSSNVSTVIMSTPYSRVTMYAVTADSEEVGKTTYGAGGENWRKVFSADVSDEVTLQEKGPSDVKVGDLSVNNPSHTQTVQVANYYSKPIGPIQVTKNLIGGTLTEEKEFVFTLHPEGFTIRDSAGNDVVLPSGEGTYQQPMPIKTIYDNEGRLVSSWLEPQARVTLGPGNTSGVAQFESIPFRFEGTYYYSITEEVPEQTSGIKYDTRTYYVKVEVEKNYTQFIKSYSYDQGMTHPAKYTTFTEIDDEDFHYLGATITYANDPKYEDEVAKCKLYLGYNPNTGKPDVKEFQVSYSAGTDVNNVAFNNELTGDLTVIKKWLDTAGNLNPESHTELTLLIQNRPVGTAEWTQYKEVKLTNANLLEDKTWKYTEAGLPLTDSNGTALEYRVVEPDNYMAIYSITYKFNGKEFYANKCDNNPDYAMKQKDGEGGIKTFGTVELTNKAVVINELPSTGGMGTAPLSILGAILILIAFVGTVLFRKKTFY